LRRPNSSSHPLRGGCLTVVQALWEIARYDFVNSTFGYRFIHCQLERQRVSHAHFQAETEALVCDAVSLASCFYVKPVLCLQRSVVAARLLRRRGISARLVIGYLPSPFFSHAWVEVEGRVVNDLAGYKERLKVLSTV
jgi:hypothetical protein